MVVRLGVTRLVNGNVEPVNPRITATAFKKLEQSFLGATLMVGVPRQRAREDAA